MPRNGSDDNDAMRRKRPWQWLAPSSSEDGDSGYDRPPRIVGIFTGMLVVLAFAYAGICLAMGSLSCALILGLGASAGVLGLWGARQPAWAGGLATQLIIGAFFCTLTGLAWRLGGHGTHALAWYGGVPVVALMIASRRSAAFWTGAVVFSLTGFYVLRVFGFVLPNDLSPWQDELLGLLSWIGLVGLLLGFALVHDQHARRMFNELRRADERLQHEKDFVDSIIASLPGTFYVIDENQHFIRWNENHVRITGYSNEEMLDLSPLDMVPEAERERIEVLMRHVLGEGHAVAEADLRMKNGSVVPYLLSARRVVIDGKAYIVGVGIDISDRKRAEAALEKRVLALTRPLDDDEAVKFDDLFNLDDIQQLQDEFARASGVASLITHVDGTPITKPSNFCRLCRDIIRKTERGCAACQRSDATIGRPHPDGHVIRPCLSAGLWDSGAPITVGGKHIANWLIGQVRDETQSEAEIRRYARAIGADEDAMAEAFYEVPAMSREQFTAIAQVLHTLANQLSNFAYQNVQQGRFIAERRQIEAQLAHARDVAEAGTRAKSEFLANMSHEIRTPLTAILGFTDVILDETREPAVRRAAETIQRSGQHLVAIISDILDLSKVEAGKLAVKREPSSPSHVVSEVVSLMRVHAETKGLALAVAYIGPIPALVKTDAARLKQILLNLVGNAVKFTDAGRVEIRVWVDERPDPDTRLWFEVVDTGIGMTREQIDCLFQPFHQVDASASRRFGGTGLGLVISQRLARMLGGDITARSVPGRGSTFSLSIKTGSTTGIERVVASESVLQRALAPDSRAAAGSCRLQGRILLAEDGPDNQRLISLLLTKAGAEVVVVENGRKAVEYASPAADRDDTTPFDLILMDIQMPVMDGLEATKRLRRDGFDQPIIALTAHAMTQDVRQCLEAGCDAHLSKPIDRITFLSTIAEFLEGGRHAAAPLAPDSEPVRTEKASP